MPRFARCPIEMHSRGGPCIYSNKVPRRGTAGLVEHQFWDSVAEMEVSRLNLQVRLPNRNPRALRVGNGVGWQLAVALVEKLDPPVERLEHGRPIFCCSLFSWGNHPNQKRGEKGTTGRPRKGHPLGLIMPFRSWTPSKATRVCVCVCACVCVCIMENYPGISPPPRHPSSFTPGAALFACEKPKSQKRGPARRNAPSAHPLGVRRSKWHAPKFAGPVSMEQKYLCDRCTRRLILGCWQDPPAKSEQLFGGLVENPLIFQNVKAKTSKQIPPLGPPVERLAYKGTFFFCSLSS